jgi:membrane protease YdiL (CAAX protease family)
MTNDPLNSPKKDPGAGHPAARSSGDPFAADLRGFGPIGIFSILVILLSGNLFITNIFFLPLGGIFALIWTLRSQTPWSDLGFIRPKSWMVTLVTGIIFGVVFKLLMKAIVMPLLGASTINTTYHFLAGNKVMLPLALLFMIVAGLAEETVFRGFLFERSRKLLGNQMWVKTFSVLFSSALFGLGHYVDQGLAGLEQAAIVGLVYGTIYAVTGRIWMLVIAHAAFDIAAVVIIYLNLESGIAHFFSNRNSFN